MNRLNLVGFAGEKLDRLPWVLRILLENALRHKQEAAAGSILAWLETGTSNAEIPFYPGRLLMHDTTCVPALVDIAAMRSELAEAGGDPTRLNPQLPIDVSVDHSIAVDRFGSPDALKYNMAQEIQRNQERYRLLKWATRALRGVRVHPPGTGIMHTMNLERLATVVNDGDCVYPDTLIGTDSHTPMVNGIGVLAWGVGGLEAESVMFGMPVMLQVPDVVGVRLTGSLPEGILATDLVLTVTERLRALRLAGKFVEFFGPGVSSLSCGERAVVANMAPEYGASTGFFPVDERTVEYLRITGRSEAHIALVEDYCKRQHLWFDAQAQPRYTEVVEIDLGKVETSIAGPHRPQDRLKPSDAKTGVVAIAAITSCTNTSDPRLVIAAGLLARKARQRGLAPPSWVKTSLAPGSPTAEYYLRRAGLLEDLEALGFGIVGFGCTTCIGNSGALVAEMVEKRGVLPVAVLSGNRNFPGRVHPQIEASFLASPPLVVAYALAGHINLDAIPLRDLWPTGAEIDAALAAALRPEDVEVAYRRAEENETWRQLDAPDTPLFPWSETSTYIRRPPFASRKSQSRLGTYTARPLIVLGDDITTDHISPAGQIPSQSDAAEYLIARGEDPKDLNVFAARRGNWEVMLRGMYTNKAVRAPIPLWRAAERYAAEGTSLVVIAGERYGTGSSRDWAAKGLWLLGVRAVLALSFERIHRSNLIGMGIIPLQLPERLTTEDTLQIRADAAALYPGAPVAVIVQGTGKTIMATAAIETSLEVDLLREGGILPYILRREESNG